MDVTAGMSLNGATEKATAQKAKKSAAAELRSETGICVGAPNQMKTLVPGVGGMRDLQRFRNQLLIVICAAAVCLNLTSSECWTALAVSCGMRNADALSSLQTHLVAWAFWSKIICFLSGVYLIIVFVFLLIRSRISKSQQQKSNLVPLNWAVLLIFISLIICPSHLLQRAVQAFKASPSNMTLSSWSGKYSYGTGERGDVSADLDLQQDATFIWKCAGNYSYAGVYGTAKLEHGSLALTPAFTEAWDGERMKMVKVFMPVTTYLVPVSWGDRKYLIYPDQVIEFCAEINQGDEPRIDEPGEYFLREDDWKKPATGLPDLPSPWTSILQSNRVVSLSLKHTTPPRLVGGKLTTARKVHPDYDRMLPEGVDGRSYPDKANNSEWYQFLTRLGKAH